MRNQELKRKLNIQKEHYAIVPDALADEDKRGNSNHYYKIEQIEQGFFDYLFSSDSDVKYNFMEIGVGTGIHAKHFLDKYKDKIKNFVACDLSKAMLDASKVRLKEYEKNLSFYQSPAEKINLDMKFDGIYVSGSMHHFADPEVAILKVKDLLKKNGVFIVCEPNVWNPYNFFRALKNRKEEIGQFTTAKRCMVRSYLIKADFDIIEEKVLHYRSGWKPLKIFWPYEYLSKYRFFDLLSIMFVFVAKNKKL